MAESASRIWDSFVEFCRERSDIIMIAGAALVVLIVIFAIVRSVAKKDDDDDFDFDEEDFQMDKAQEENEQTDSKGLTESKILSEEKIKETVKGDGIESLLEQIAAIPTKNLEEVEIKIQGAELKLKYTKNGPKEEAGERAEAAADGACGEEIKEERKEEPKDAAGEAEPADSSKEVIIKKFGPDNINTSRSGIVFTEEQLEEQIRD